MKRTQSGMGKFTLLLSAFVFIAIVSAFVIVPLPQLITYKRADLVSSGIYWRGFGDSGQLLDTQADFVKVDDPTNSLHVCQIYAERQQSCQKYRIIERQGPFHALWFFITN